MEGNADFHPDAPRRSPDPSIEEMLRRARAARLGGDAGTSEAAGPRFTPFPTTERQPASGGWLGVCAALVIGVLLGMLIISVAMHTNALPSGLSGQVATPMPLSPSAPTPMPVVPTDTPLPPPTNTPAPPPTDVPTATVEAAVPSSPTTEGIVSLAKAYYDQQGPFAGTYVLLDATAVQIQSQDDTQLTVCIAYEVATLAAPDTVADTGTRTFTLVAADDGTWQVVQMGDAGSCTLS